jgi:hypothetical protein
MVHCLRANSPANEWKTTAALFAQCSSTTQRNRLCLAFGIKLLIDINFDSPDAGIWPVTREKAPGGHQSQPDPFLQHYALCKTTTIYNAVRIKYKYSTHQLHEYTGHSRYHRKKNAAIFWQRTQFYLPIFPASIVCAIKTLS